MRRATRFSSITILCLLFSVSIDMLSAQQTTATFYAVVTDPSGAIIPGATVTLRHEGTGARLTRTASAVGEAVLDFLRVGSYTIRMEAAGFKAL